MALIDVNNFKLINDRCGHAAGDAALRDIANAVRSCIRKTDILIRYGGDEFLLLFSRMTMEAFLDKKKADPAGRARHPHVRVRGYPAFGQHRRHLRRASDHRGYPQGGLSDVSGQGRAEVLKNEIPCRGDRKSVPGRGFFAFFPAAARRSLRKEPRQRDGVCARSRGSATGACARSRVFNFVLPPLSRPKRPCRQTNRPRIPCPYKSQ